MKARGQKSLRSAIGQETKGKKKRELRLEKKSLEKPGKHSLDQPPTIGCDRAKAWGVCHKNTKNRIDSGDEARLHGLNTRIGGSGRKRSRGGTGTPEQSRPQKLVTHQE